MKRYNTMFVLALVCIAFICNNTNAQEEIQFSTNGQIFKSKHKPRPPQNNSECPNDTYRTIDGECNNTRSGRSDYGSASSILYRSMISEYGQQDHYNSMGGQSRLSPREISNILCATKGDNLNSINLSSFVFTWGQFLDHDISLTPEAHDEYEPIEVPLNDPLFVNDIPFFRSAVASNSGINTPREQINLITSWIDASNVYGSDADRAGWLRTFVDGKLKTSQGGLLPFNTTDGNYNSDIDPDAPSMAGDGGGLLKTYVAGDVRAGEQPGLTSLHTLFVRVHNHTCEILMQNGVEGDEDLYQKARKEVGALIQSITYNEFLPALGVDLPHYREYDNKVRPDISNLFATAAYRFGHTMVTDQMLLLSDNCQEIGPGELPLLAGFFNPEILRTYNVEPIFKGLAYQKQNEVDLDIIDNLRNFLFGDPNDPGTVGLDLASLNIQRGRDHGLPDYNTVRAEYLGKRVRNFREITTNGQLARDLEEAYGSVNDIDLWVGLLAEDKLPSKSMGPTMHKILSKQFEALRDGDRFYFENDRMYSRDEIRRIARTTLSDLIVQHTGLTNLQDNVFFANTCNKKTIELSTEALDYQSSEGFSIYPNPFANEVTIKIPGDSKGATEIMVYNSQGQLVKNETHDDGLIRINTETLVAGQYFILIKTQAFTEIMKLVKH